MSPSTTNTLVWTNCDVFIRSFIRFGLFVDDGTRSFQRVCKFHFFLFLSPIQRHRLLFLRSKEAHRVLCRVLFCPTPDLGKPIYNNLNVKHLQVGTQRPPFFFSLHQPKGRQESISEECLFNKTKAMVLWSQMILLHTLGPN